MTRFKKEADLCAAFISTLPKQWTAYPETAGFDMVLVHETGVQIGVEAKLVLNPKVVCQAMEKWTWWNGAGPDFRAVLVDKINANMHPIVKRMGLTVITVHEEQRGIIPAGNRVKGSRWYSRPTLPCEEIYGREEWFDCVPERRCRLPDYVPDVVAGDTAPVKLSDWKVKAIKICVCVRRFGAVDRAAFRELRIDPSRWIDGSWLKPGAARGLWVAGPYFPEQTFRNQHPTVFAEIEADFEAWGKDITAPQGVGDLFEASQ